MRMSAGISRRKLIAGAACLMAAPAHAARDGAPDWLELPIGGMERLDANVWIAKIAANLWVTCFTFYAGGLGWVPCNGLVIGAPSGTTIIDTGNTAQQGEILLDAAQRVSGAPVKQAIATHFHGDRTGGTAAMLGKGIPVLGHPFTVGLAMAYGEPVPQGIRGLEKDAVDFGTFELFYPGPGHTRDNITVWHRENKCLFGGCLLRATTDRQIGSRSDADMTNYLSTLDRLVKRYPGRRLTIPGHGAVAGDAVEWTREKIKETIARDRRDDS